ncbi:MAG: class III cytochrome C [Deltaproteobacteria bacterium]|nr:MAG: class III cytochrome C [Deltaproteobacteria bacterium]
MTSKRKTTVRLILAALLMLALPAWASAADAPDVIAIDLLERYYEGVEFEHAMHVDIADDCYVCHHHTVGTVTVEMGCADCHEESDATLPIACKKCHDPNPFSAAQIAKRELEGRRFHIDKPGLKGAYHRSCLGCHEEMGAPNGCDDCHRRNEAGEELFGLGPADM